jgi:TonB family protein
MFGDIEQCQSADPEAPPETAELACATIRTEGPPPDVIPARAVFSSSPWVRREDYPAKATNNRSRGTVEILFEVDEGGRISDCRIYRSSGDPDLDNPPCKALKTGARFTPAHQNGKAVRAAGTREVHF